MFPVGSGKKCRVLYRWPSEDLEWGEVQYVTGDKDDGKEQVMIVGCGALFLMGVTYSGDMEIVFEQWVDEEWEMVERWGEEEEADE